MKRFQEFASDLAGRLGGIAVGRIAAVTAVAVVLSGGSILLAAVSNASAGDGHGNNTGWVGTWATAEVPAGTSGLSLTGFDDQTVRNVIHTSVGGSGVRIRISNTFGTQPLVVSAADVGIAGSGAAVEPGTNQEATFHGSDSVTIQPGEEVLSDPVNLAVGSEQNLAVSTYFAAATGPATWHPDAIGTNYYASGNAAADSSGDPFANTTTSWYFLDGVDVLNPTVKGAVVAFGASVTDGTGSTSNGNLRYPDDLARRLLQLPAGQRLSVLDAGISGDELLTDGGTSGAAGVARFLRDGVRQDGVRDIIIWLGTNDIGFHSTINPSVMTDAYQELIDIAHQNGIKVIGATLQPDEGNSEFSPQGNVTREAVNNWILTSGEFDAGFDFSTVLEDPADTKELRPAYDSGDHLHPNDVGYQATADSINLETLTSPDRVQDFAGTATPSDLSATFGTDSSNTESVTLHSLTNHTFTLPWKLSAPAGSGISVSPNSGRVTIPANGTATLSFTVETSSVEGNNALDLSLFDRDGESALESHFTVVVS